MALPVHVCQDCEACRFDGLRDGLRARGIATACFPGSERHCNPNSSPPTATTITVPRDNMIGHFIRFDDWQYSGPVAVVLFPDGMRVGVPLAEPVDECVDRVCRLRARPGADPECVVCFGSTKKDGVMCSRCWKAACGACSRKTQIVRRFVGVWSCPCCRQESTNTPWDIVTVTLMLERVNGGFRAAIRRGMRRLGATRSLVYFTGKLDGMARYVWALAVLGDDADRARGRSPRLFIESPFFDTIARLVRTAGTDFTVGTPPMACGSASKYRPDNVDFCSAYTVEEEGVFELLGGFIPIHMTRRMVLETLDLRGGSIIRAGADAGAGEGGDRDAADQGVQRVHVLEPPPELVV